MLVKINNPLKTLKCLKAFYLKNGVSIIEKKESSSEKEIEKLFSSGLPILYKGKKYLNSKEEASKFIIDYLGADTLINVRYGNFSDPSEYAFNRQEKKIQLKEYLDDYFNKKADKTHYFGNYSLNNDIITKMNIQKPQVYNEKDISAGRLWVGEKGCITPLHCDGGDNFVYQLFGEKKWTLIPPSDYQSIYLNSMAGIPEEDFWCSSVDLSNIDYKKYKKVNKITPFEVVLKAGDSLYLPYGWFHYVETIEDSVMINFWVANKKLTPAIASRFQTYSLWGYTYIPFSFGKLFNKIMGTNFRTKK